VTSFSVVYYNFTLCIHPTGNSESYRTKQTKGINVDGPLMVTQIGGMVLVEIKI
jgi:hypothetical protein